MLKAHLPSGDTPKASPPHMPSFPPPGPAPKSLRKTLRRSTGLLNLDEAATDDHSSSSLKRPYPSDPRSTKPGLRRRDSSPSAMDPPPVIPPVWQAPLRRRDSFDQLFSPDAYAFDHSTPIHAPPPPPAAVNPYSTSPSPSPIPASKSQHYNSASLHTRPRHSLPGPASHKPRPKFNASLAAEYGDYHTPDNYRTVKPLQTAFMSTGLMSKRNRMNMPNDGHRMPPDTPCKKPSNTSLPNMSFSGWYNNNNTNANANTSINSNQHSTPLRSEDKALRKSRLGLHDSLLRFSVDYGNTSTPAAEVDTPMRDTFFDDPETPTKETSGHFAHPIAMPQPIPAAATRQVSDASTITLGHIEKRRMTSTPQPRDQDWMEHSSSEQSLTSPRTPSIGMHSDPSQLASSADSSAGLELGALSMLHRTTSSKNILPDVPKTPARTPKTPADLQLHSTTFGTLGKAAAESYADGALTSRFGRVALIGSGEFSVVYSVSDPLVGAVDTSAPLPHHDNRFAVKRTKYPFMGPKARSRRLEEVEILRSLSHDGDDGDDGRDYILTLMDFWECNGHLYIMTEFCDNGNLDTFLSERGNVSRLDEWRVWKILVEIALGLRYIHQRGFLHLDIKPANVFITFEGMLKIGDFGMATRYPAAKGIEREGDREYIAPEVLSRQQYDSPADIFSLGLMMLEIAANIVLPDNGIHWQKLRSGDLSEAGRLSSGDLAGTEDDDDILARFSLGDSDVSKVGSPMMMPASSTGGSSLNGRSRVPSWSPAFMVGNTGALDRMVQWMLDPNPRDRPSAEQIILSDECQWVETHRKAGAVIYEGDYGPEPDPVEPNASAMLLADEPANWRRGM